jgi:hypothetical protein
MPKVIPFILAGGGKDVILLNIRREVIILIRLTPSWVVLLVLQPVALVILQGSAERVAPALS